MLEKTAWIRKFMPEGRDHGGKKRRQSTGSDGGKHRIFLILIIFGLALGLAACGEELTEEEAQKLAGGRSAQPLNVLVVDDDEGLAETSTWTDTLDAMGAAVSSYDVDVLATNGDAVLLLDNYDVVIWSIGNRAWDNLTSANVATLSAYLDNGGRLLYSGGHGVFSELLAGASAFIDTYLGLTAYFNHMPTFVNNAAPANTTGSGHSAVGSATYTLRVWPGGEFDNMFSGFYAGLPSATGLLDHQPANLTKTGAPDYNGFIAMANDPGVYKTITWGFDLNHVDPADWLSLLAGALNFLAQ